MISKRRTTSVTIASFQSPGYIGDMAQYKVVHALSWQHEICSVFFESNDPSIALAQATLLSERLNDEYRVIDAWTPANQLPTTARPLFKMEGEVSR